MRAEREEGKGREMLIAGRQGGRDEGQKTKLLAGHWPPSVDSPLPLGKWLDHRKWL